MAEKKEKKSILEILIIVGIIICLILMVIFIYNDTQDRDVKTKIVDPFEDNEDASEDVIEDVIEDVTEDKQEEGIVLKECVVKTPEGVGSPLPEIGVGVLCEKVSDCLAVPEFREISLSDWECKETKFKKIRINWDYISCNNLEDCFDPFSPTSEEKRLTDGMRCYEGFCEGTLKFAAALESIYG
ncbi:hypothetical protein ACFLZB_00595 [Nanoarchaeota archaeon]